MFPAATAAPFARNVARRGIFVIFPSVFEFCYVLLSFLTVHYGIRDGPLRETGCRIPEAQGRTTVVRRSARGLPRMPVRFVPAAHVLLRFLTFRTFWSSSHTLFTFC